MITKYLTNGKLDDPNGTGITINSYQIDDAGNVVGLNHTADGQPYFGYLSNEIGVAQYLAWKEIIANPDGITYFHGVFPVGVVDAATRAMLDARGVASGVAADIMRRAIRSVTRLQGLAALSRRGITKTDIYAVIGAMPAAQTAEALLWFEESQTFVRNSQYVNGIGSALGLSQTDIDDLFDAAEAIV